MTDDNWQAQLLRSMDPPMAPTDRTDPAAPSTAPAVVPAGDPPPVPRPVFFGGTATDAVEGVETLVRHAGVHGDPLTHRWGRALRTMLGREATREIEELATLAERGNRAITTGRRITVAGVRGGAGKSTVSALVTTTLAGLRRDPVLAVDADADAGSLPLRLGPLGVGVRTAADGGIAQASAFDKVARYLDRTVTGVWLWRRALSAALARQDEEHAALLLRDRARFLSRYFAVAVADLGTGMHGAANRALIADSHAVVLTGAATLDGVLGANAALRRLSQDHGPALLGRTVLVLTTTVPGPLGVDLRRATDGLRNYGVPVLELPYDRHLALGAAIDQQRIGARTRTAALRIAAETMDLAVRA
jgi:MinD-like ATPase involved in chromosome partitioning or flagellar assembly